MKKPVILCLVLLAFFAPLLSVVYAGDSIDDPTAGCCPRMFIWEGSWIGHGLIPLPSVDALQTINMNYSSPFYIVKLVEEGNGSDIDFIALKVNGIETAPIFASTNAAGDVSAIYTSDDNYLHIAPNQWIQLWFTNTEPSTPPLFEIEGHSSFF